MGDGKQLEFVGFSSCINPSFWHKLSQLKLDVFKLDESATEIWGYYSNLNCHSKPILEVDSTSFNKDYNGLKYSLPYHGLLINKNTIEQFKDCDKKDILMMSADRIKSLLDSKVIENPSLLNYFLVLSYADLKKYNFYYWFAFVAHANFKPDILNFCGITTILNEQKQNDLYKEYTSLSVNNKCFFVVNYKNFKVETLKEWKNCDNYDDYLFVFSDPSVAKEHPGWPLRNFILFLVYHCKNIKGKKIKFLGLRLQTVASEINCSESIIWDVIMPSVENVDQELSSNSWLGFELNERTKMGPRLAKMKESMLPTSLAESAVDFNLKLMKWRLLPDINLDVIKQSKCLLLGSGTLGCAVARNLLAWGVRNITFVDNGSVSYSNPVRQSLYTFEDCISNKPKALAAADNMKKIFPGVETAGYNFSIPMPGHPVGESLMQQTRESTEMLTSLIEEHDIVFLLMDSRESRWLPTLLGASLEKTVINAALGFDTYLIMRHGTRGATSKPENLLPNNDLKCIAGDKLGCYFCNDITAPGDSLKDRTLDQQCTVTRPGVANIAGALAVELAISLLQHENGASAPAFYATSKNADISRDNECSLGILPHSIRGFLSLFSHVLPGTERYDQCIACSDIVVEEYKNKGFDFLLQVFNTSKYLEELTGLNKIYMDGANLEEWDLSDNEECE